MGIAGGLGAVKGRSEAVWQRHGGSEAEPATVEADANVLLIGMFVLSIDERRNTDGFDLCWAVNAILVSTGSCRFWKVRGQIFRAMMRCPL